MFTNLIRMGIAVLSQWRSLIDKHLGRKVAGKSVSLMIDILCVDRGIKPSYLYDIGPPKAEQLYNLVNSLYRSGLIRNNLNVLQLELDCLIVNVDALNEAVSTPEEICHRLINISFQRPSLTVGRDEALKLHTDLVTLLNNMDRDRVKLYVHSFLGDICNVTSLFGLLLGYPAVYWYDTKIGHERIYLSMEPLCCVSVKINCSVEGKSLKAAQENHLLYSFSFPACFKVEIDEVVKTWYHTIKAHMGTADYDLIEDMTLSMEERQFPSVSL